VSYEEFQRRVSDNWLDPKEASVYVMLAKSGSLKASELARLCDISRMDAYRILRRLETRGVVETVMGRPMKFQAVPPEKAFDTLLKSENEKLSAMQSEKNSLVSLWPTQPVFEEERKDAEKLRIIQGRAEFYGAFRRAINDTNKHLDIITTRNGLSRLFHIGLDKDMEEKAEKGVSIRILCRVNAGETEAGDRFASIAKLRYPSNPLNTQVMVSDGFQAIVSTALDDSMSLSSDKDTSIWTNSRDQLALLDALFEEFWCDSSDLGTARHLIETGSPSPGLRRLIGHDAIINVKQETLKTAKQSITILTPSITTSPTFKDAYVDLLNDSYSRGVQVRVMTTLMNEDTKMVKSLEKTFKIRVTYIEPTIDIILVDQKTFIGDKLLSSADRQLQEEAIYVSDPVFGSVMHQFLNITWRASDRVTPVLHYIEWINHSAFVLQRVAASMNERGYHVETPGIVKGSSSLEYTFPLVARKKGDQRTVLVERCTDSQQISTLYAKTVDCNVSATILLTPPDFQAEASRLASFFGMRVLSLSPSEDGPKKITDAVLSAFASD
jgi:sugar-specific transcriptional regulator TrmB